MKVHFNNPEFADERSKTEKLTLQEENKAVEFINELIQAATKNYVVGEKSVANLQKLVWNYENLCHYHAHTYKGEVKNLHGMRMQLTDDIREVPNYMDIVKKDVAYSIAKDVVEKMNLTPNAEGRIEKEFVLITDESLLKLKKLISNLKKSSDSINNSLAEELLNIIGV